MIGRTNIKQTSTSLSTQRSLSDSVRRPHSIKLGLPGWSVGSHGRCRTDLSRARQPTLLEGFGPEGSPHRTLPSATVQAVLSRHERRLLRMQQRADAKQPQGKGLSTSQFVDGLRTLAKEHNAPWLSDLLAVIHESWMIADQGKGGRHRRAAVLDCVAVLLHDYSGHRRQRAANDRPIESRTADREVLQRLVVATVLSGGGDPLPLLSMHACPDRSQTYRVLATSGEADGWTYSPCTFEDEARIHPGTHNPAIAVHSDERGPSIVAVFGVEAAGIRQLSRALEGECDPQAGASRIITLESLRPLSQLLGTLRRTRDLSPRLIHIPMPAIADDPLFHEEVLECLYASRLGSGEGAARVVLSFNACATWQWVASGVMGLEASMDRILLGPRTASGIVQVLNDLSFCGTQPQVNALAREVGPWHERLQSFVRSAHRHSGSEGLQTLLDHSSDSLRNLDPSSVHRVLREFGLFEIPKAFEIFKDLVARGRSRFDRESLNTTANEPPFREHSAETLIEWGLHLSLLSADADQPDLLRIDPTVVALIERIEAST